MIETEEQALTALVDCGWYSKETPCACIPEVAFSSSSPSVGYVSVDSNLTLIQLEALAWFIRRAEQQQDQNKK